MLTTYVLESAKNKHHHHHHHHHHDEDFAALPNPHAHLSAEDRLARLLMMLEAQFGTSIAPIDRPRVPADLVNGTEGIDGVETEVHEERLADIESAELDRLQALGIPVPGLEITVDKHVARVWLENLEVECTNPVLRDRVRVVVERAVETVAGLWAASSMPKEIVSNGTSKGQMEIDAVA
jgi:cleavage and polyadenylation specificity factor subunit 3